jgi:NADH-quinone oxidoreductase subunit J
MEVAVFLVLSFVIIASALAVVTVKNIFHCALFLILCLFSVAGFYVLLHAEFIAVVQVLIYVGAVAILMIFAIMLTSRLSGQNPEMTNEKSFLGGFLSLVLFVVIWVNLNNTMFKELDVEPHPDSAWQIGRLLMTEFVLPFELVSVLLLAALIGAIVIARREGN